MSGAAMAALLGHLWRRHWPPLLPMAAGVALFEFVITRMAPAPDEVSWMSRILAVVPPQLLALAGNEIASASPRGFVALGYGHPFFLLLLSAWGIRVSSAALAGEIGRGTMDLLAARPMSRWQHVIAANAAVGAGLALLIGAAWGGTAVGLTLRPLGLTASQFLGVAVMAWLLFLAWGALGLLISATQREAGPAIAWTSGLMAASFVLEYLARLWKPIAGLRPFSLFAYYRPQQIAIVGLDPSDVARVAGVAIVAVAVAVAVFRRRDL